MRNLVRRALDRLTGSAAQGKPGAARQKKGEAPTPGAETPPSAAAAPQDAGAAAAAARGRGKRVPPAGGGRAALIENALAIQRDQARIFDQLQPDERKRLRALAKRTFAPVLKDEAEPARKPAAPAAAKPTQPASPPGRRRP